MSLSQSRSGHIEERNHNGLSLIHIEFAEISKSKEHADILF